MIAVAKATSGGLTCLLLPHVPNLLHRIHQRQLLPALIAVSYMGVERLGFIRGEAGPVTLARRRSGPLLTGDENDVDLAVEIGVG